MKLDLLAGGLKTLIDSERAPSHPLERRNVLSASSICSMPAISSHSSCMSSAT